MLWATHQRIAREVMNRLGVRLSSQEMAKLLEGVIAPDKLHEQVAVHAYPHHYGKSGVIGQYLLMARRSFLQYDSLSTYYNLGVALHYIQDAHTTYPSFLPRHREWEEWIENSFIVSDNNIETAIRDSVKNRSLRRECSHLATQLSREVEGRDATIAAATLNGQIKNQETIASPKVDLYLGFRASYVVSKSVLGSRTNSALDVQLANNLSAHEKLLKTAENDLSTRIFTLIRKRDQIKERIVSPSGVVAKAKNWVNGMRVGFKEKSIHSNLEIYSNKEHFDPVAKQYITRAGTITNSYGGWYNFQIPQLRTSVVPHDLLSIEEASKMLGLDQQSLSSLLNDKKIPINVVGNHKIVKRMELDALLDQCPINGFNRCPSEYQGPALSGAPF